MWVLTFGGWFIAFGFGALAFGLLCDGIACIMALVLVCSRSGTDRSNGWIKLALEFFAFCAAALVSTQSSGRY